MDADNKVARFESHDRDLGQNSIVQDLSRGVAYRFTRDDKCIIEHMNTSIFHKTSHSMKVARTVQEIMHMEGDFYRVGIGMFLTGLQTALVDQTLICRFSSRHLMRSMGASCHR